MNLLNNSDINTYCLNLLNSANANDVLLFPILEILFKTGCRVSEVFDDRFYVENNQVKLLPKKSNFIRTFNINLFTVSTSEFVFNRQAWNLYSFDSALRSLRRLEGYRKTFVKTKCIDFHIFRYNYIRQLIDVEHKQFSEVVNLLGYTNSIVAYSYYYSQISQ